MKRNRIAVGCSVLLVFAMMFESYDHISLFMSYINIPMGLLTIME